VKLKISLGRAALTVGIASLIHDVGAAIGQGIRRSRRRR
jgi:hypothetical protein